jgi:hypothetical protein
MGVRIRSGDGRYQIQVDAVATSDDRVLVFQRLQFDVSPRGAVTGQSVVRLFPRSPAGR